MNEPLSPDKPDCVTGRSTLPEFVQQKYLYAECAVSGATPSA
jgi:hypothetical protein